MSSSAPQQRAAAPETALFQYPDAGAPDWAPDGTQAKEEQSRRQLAESFEQGRQTGQQQLRAECDSSLARNREQMSRALQQFSEERQSYFRRVEAEVVQLALAIARKILHRESQIDPQTLAGIVRVTLEKLDTRTRVTLRVPPAEAAAWRHYFASRVEDTPAPEVVEDGEIAGGECRIETSLGSSAVGLESQLKEVETGLLDLLAARPEAAAAVGERAVGEREDS
jgi:flagellar assembly protein FliH